MSRENPSGADNQQERLRVASWIVGFVDGEGCFSCPIQRNTSMTFGWQLQPRFAVVQGERSSSALELIQRHLGCGNIYRNRRHDNHREDLMTYSVYRLRDLLDVVIPFFEVNQLRTAKREDFDKFAVIVRMMDRKQHLTSDGLRRIAEIAQTMNHRKPSRFLESSEAIRQPSPTDVGVEDMVLPS